MFRGEAEQGGTQIKCTGNHNDVTNPKLQRSNVSFYLNKTTPAGGITLNYDPLLGHVPQKSKISAHFTAS